MGPDHSGQGALCRGPSGRAGASVPGRHPLGSALSVGGSLPFGVACVPTPVGGGGPSCRRAGWVPAGGFNTRAGTAPTPLGEATLCVPSLAASAVRRPKPVPPALGWGSPFASLTRVGTVGAHSSARPHWAWEGIVALCAGEVGMALAASPKSPVSCWRRP